MSAIIITAAFLLGLFLGSRWAYWQCEKRLLRHVRKENEAIERALNSAFPAMEGRIRYD